MGFAPAWQLPAGSRAGLRAVGNAVPPPLAKAVMACADHAATALPAGSVPGPNAEERTRPDTHADEMAVLRRKLRRLSKRVAALGRTCDGMD